MPSISMTVNGKAVCGDVEGRTIGLRRVDVAFQAKAGGCHGQHAAKLAATQNADG